VVRFYNKQLEAFEPGLPPVILPTVVLKQTVISEDSERISGYITFGL
jgi:hypothetical protein